MEFEPLIAQQDLGDIIGLIVTVVIIGFSVLSKVISAAGGGKKPQQRRVAQGPQVRQQPRPQQPPRPHPGPGARSVEAEIEDFLREARGGKQQQRPQPKTASHPATPPPTAQRPRVIEATPVDQDVVPGQGFGRDLTEHVAEHIGRDSISTRDAHLGEKVGMADERLEEHLDKIFDHDVGHIEHADEVDTSIKEGTDANAWSEKQAPENKAAKKIRKMLSSPDSVRDVFIMAEILKRPEI